MCQNLTFTFFVKPCSQICVMYFSHEQIGNTELSRQDTIKIRKSYGCDACGGPQHCSGGDIKTADSVTESSCTWWLTTDSNKQIDIEISVKIIKW